MRRFAIMHEYTCDNVNYRGFLVFVKKKVIINITLFTSLLADENKREKAIFHPIYDPFNAFYVISLIRDNTRFYTR